MLIPYLVILIFFLHNNAHALNNVTKNDESDSPATRFLIESSFDFDSLVNLTSEFDFQFVDTITNNNTQLFIFKSTAKPIRKRSMFNLTFTHDDLITQTMNQITKHPNITSIHRERILERTKRDFIDQPEDEMMHKEIPLASSVFRNLKGSRDIRISKLTGKVFGNYTEEDPMWPYLWYMNRHTFHKNLTDMNITSAWVQGYTGKGVSVTFLDDGLEHDHPDIIQNYDPEASFDFNDNDPDPMPRYDVTNENKHGTRCAGEVAATGNNSICSIGIAYNAGIGGIRMLDGPIYDSIEAKSLSLNNQHVDIYSASWGPTDNGEQLDGPDRLASQALRDGVTMGRHGLGSIFTWASGNGGIYGDSCACDGYVNNIHTFAISSTTDQGTKPWYLEECASILATTYSSGDISRGQHSIATTDLRHKCTKSHTATSAAAPIAAGIIALALEANPKLTWRDVMFMIVLTSRPHAIKSNEYFENKAGFLVSSRYGFGLMDAGRMVEVARNWETVPEFKSCYSENSTISSDKSANFDRYETFLFTDGCQDSADEVNFIEQVEVIVSLRTPRRGHIELHLTSPQGTRHRILQKRPRDRSHRGFKRWPFNTLQLWGESPKGVWKLHVTDFNGDTFIMDRFELLIHGTKERPRIYETFRTNNNEI